MSLFSRMQNKAKKMSGELRCTILVVYQDGSGRVVQSNGFNGETALSIKTPLYMFNGEEDFNRKKKELLEGVTT